jgi:2,4-dienoyl-CoA reductase-like NADH-dependent reductase (Old Yellow Enzyme family)
MPINLFEPITVGKLEIKNRFVRSAMWDGTADPSGAATDASEAIYRQLAEGGVGLIMTGFAFVSSLGQAMFGQYGIHNDDMIPGLKRLVRAAHGADARIATQIVHCGINSVYLPKKGIEALALSAMPGADVPHRVMTGGDIEEIIADFIAAAVRAAEAGFDAVQLHSAHGYLMSQALSPLFNRRTDIWGGSSENRRRMHIEVIKGIKNALGASFPVMIKMGVQDEVEGGMPLAEGIEAAGKMVDAGLSGIEVSAGAGDRSKIGPDRVKPERAFFRERAAALKRSVDTPVMLVCGIRSLEMARDIVDSGDADMISMCRPFIREPGLIARWQKGDGSPANCVSCSKCRESVFKQEPLRCLQLRK